MLRLVVLFSMTLASVPVIAADLGVIRTLVENENKEGSSQAGIWQSYVRQYPAFRDFSNLANIKELALPLDVSSPLGLADGLSRTVLFFSDQGSINSAVSHLADLSAIRTLALRSAIQRERNIILATTAQMALHQYNETKENREELFTVNYWRDYFIRQHGDFAFYITISDTLNTRAVAAAIAVNKVFGKSYDFSQLQGASGMSFDMFDNFVTEIDGATSWIMTKYALTAAAEGDFIARFNLATLLANNTNIEQRRQAYGLFDEVFKKENKDPDIQAVALFHKAQLFQQEGIGDLSKELDPIYGFFPGGEVSLGGKKLEDKELGDPPTTRTEYAALWLLDARMIAESSTIVGQTLGALGTIFTHDNNPSKKQIARVVEIFTRKISSDEDKDGDYGFKLGRIYYHGIEGFYLQDKEKASGLWSQAADKGNTGAQLRLAYIMYNGRDYDAACKLFLKAAEGNDKDAQYMFGYLTRLRIASGDWKAFQWLLKSAQQGHVEAQQWVAMMLYGGEGTKKDREQAFQWSLKAAQQGDVESQQEVAERLEAGDGTKKNPEQGAQWRLKTAQQGNAKAQQWVAARLEAGDGTKKNPEQAAQWRLRAAAQESADASS